VKVIDPAKFNNIREYHAAVVDRVVNSTDRDVIEQADDELANELAAQWWESHRAEFSLEFEEESPDRWAAIISAKRRKMEAWVADQIRQRIEAAV
jgi:hypothetical protein